MRILSIFFIFTVYYLYGDDNFLANSEYAKMLYNNPRGISCAICHGERGEGSVISTYTIEKNGDKIYKEIKAPQINQVDMETFLKAFEKKKKFMPRYYLTQKELAYIYYYLLKQRKDYENKKQ